MNTKWKRKNGAIRTYGINGVQGKIKAEEIEIKFKNTSKMRLYYKCSVRKQNGEWYEVKSGNGTDYQILSFAKKAVSLAVMKESMKG